MLTKLIRFHKNEHTKSTRKVNLFIDGNIPCIDAGLRNSTQALE